MSTAFLAGLVALAGCLKSNPAWNEGPDATTDAAATSATSNASVASTGATTGDDSTTLIPPGGESGEDVDTDLVLHLRLDETQGAIADDASVTDAVCTLEGTPAWVPAHQSGGLELDPSDDVDYVLCDGDDTLMNAQRGDYTLAAWVYPLSTPPDAASEAFAIVIRSGFDLGLFYEGSEEFVLIDWQDDTTGTVLRSLATFPPGGWHHVATTVDREAGELRLYVDGTLLDQTDASPGATGYDFGAGPWEVGYDMPGTNHAAHMRIDEVRIYARALTPEQIAALAAQ